MTMRGCWLGRFRLHNELWVTCISVIHNHRTVLLLSMSGEPGCELRCTLDKMFFLSFFWIRMTSFLAQWGGVQNTPQLCGRMAHNAVIVISNICKQFNSGSIVSPYVQWGRPTMRIPSFTSTVLANPTKQDLDCFGADYQSYHTKGLPCRKLHQSGWTLARAARGRVGTAALRGRLLTKW